MLLLQVELPLGVLPRDTLVNTSDAHETSRAAAAVRCVPPVAFAIVTYEAVGLRETSPEWSLVGFAVALCAPDETGRPPSTAVDGASTPNDARRTRLGRRCAAHRCVSAPAIHASKKWPCVSACISCERASLKLDSRLCGGGLTP